MTLIETYKYVPEGLLALRAAQLAVPSVIQNDIQPVGTKTHDSLAVILDAGTAQKSLEVTHVDSQTTA